MIWKPKLGHRVRLNYKNKTKLHQWKTGTVFVCTTGLGGSDNALVRLNDGTFIVVP